MTKKVEMDCIGSCANREITIQQRLAENELFLEFVDDVGAEAFCSFWRSAECKKAFISWCLKSKNEDFEEWAKEHLI